MKDILFLDLETFSKVDLKKHGSYIYAKDCEIILFAWVINHDLVQVWDCLNEPMPMKLKYALNNINMLKVAHNQAFDRKVIHEQLTFTDIEHWFDTMALAYTLGLPGSLERMVMSLGADVDYQKVADGKRLIKMFCLPQKITENQPFERRDHATDPADWIKFIEYARQDVESMRWAYYEMPKWVMGGDKENSKLETKIWRLHEKINDRGLPVDLDLAKAAISATSRRIEELNNELAGITRGAATSHSQRDKVLAWIRSEGIYVVGYTKEDLTDLLKLDLPANVQRVVEIRQEAGRTSTAKYQALMDGTDPETKRLCGGIQYYGAKRTGRSAGRRFQPHNLPHPEIPDSDNAAEALINNTVDLLYEESIMSIGVSCVRSSIKAPDGKKLLVSDLSNIEGRVLAWLAGEKWKLQAFRDYDTIIGYDDEGKAIRKGPDIYKLAFHKSFGTPLEQITSKERQIGKFQELSLGYQGGVAAFYKQAKKFNTNMMDIYEQVIDSATPDQLSSAEWMVDYIRENNHELDHLSPEEIIGADIVKQSWREANSKIVSYWFTLEDMVYKAIENTGGAYSAGRIKAAVRDDKLLILLPSKRPLVYNQPRIKSNGYISYLTFEKNAWRSTNLYGGKTAENGTQAVARDILMSNMIPIDKKYPILGTVHDETVSEVFDEDATEENLTDLNTMLAVNPSWADGLPLAADGYIAQRYRKN